MASLCLLSLPLGLAWDSNAVTLSWQPSAGAVSYRIWSATAGQFSIATIATDTNATLSVTLPTEFYVTALDASGLESDPSNIVSYTPPVNSAPPAPTALRGQQIQGWRVDLVWSSALTASTEVERSSDGAGFGRITTVPAGTQHYTDLSIRKRVQYIYRVRSVSQFGVSGYSNLLYYTAQ